MRLCDLGMMSPYLLVAFSRGCSFGKARAFEQGVLAELAFDGVHGAREVVLAFVGLMVAE